MLPSAKEQLKFIIYDEALMHEVFRLSPCTQTRLVETQDQLKQICAEKQEKVNAVETARPIFWTIISGLGWSVSEPSSRACCWYYIIDVFAESYQSYAMLAYIFTKTVLKRSTKKDLLERSGQFYILGSDVSLTFRVLMIW